MGLSGHQGSDKLRIGKSAWRQWHFLSSLNAFENLRLWRLRQDSLQPIQGPIAAVDVGDVLCRKMKASLWQPSGPLLCDPNIPPRFSRILPEQYPVLH